MPKKPGSIEELEQWFVDNPDIGKLDGEFVVKPGTSEFRYGYVPGYLYDLALLKGAALSFSKSDIGTYSFTRLVTTDLSQLTIPTEEAKTEFRVYIPTGLYEIAQKLKDERRLSNSQLMTIALSLFVDDPGINQIYQIYLEGLAAKHNATTEEVERKIFGYRKYMARLTRLEESKKRGYFVGDRKLY